MSYPGSIWLSMWCAGEHKTEADFAAVRDSGVVDGVEIWTEHPHALWEVEMGAKYGLQVGIHLPFHDLNPVSADPVVAAAGRAFGDLGRRAIASYAPITLSLAHANPADAPHGAISANVALKAKSCRSKTLRTPALVVSQDPR